MLWCVYIDVSLYLQEDMGMTYDELSIFGRLRKQAFCGPYSMFCKLIHTWRETCSASEVGEEVYIQSELYDVFTQKYRG